MRSFKMYDIQANEDYQNVCQGSGSNIYLCLVLVGDSAGKGIDETMICMQKREESRQKLCNLFFEGAKLFGAMLTGAFLHAALEGWIQALF